MHLDQLRRQAKELLRAHRAGDPEARDRLAGDEPKLADAQLAVARELGFPSWPRLVAYAGRGDGLQQLYHEDLDYYAGRATGLLESARDGTPAALAVFERHEVPVSTLGAQTVVAREHGLRSWRVLQERVAGLRASGEPFAAAYRAVEARDADALSTQLDRFPELVQARGTNGNDLLGMAGATGSRALVRLLLDRGADPASRNAHGWTALHQAAYADSADLARLLLDHGAPADVEARGTGGTPLVVALFWGNRRVAEVLLAAAGPQPPNLRVAAGTGAVADLATAPGDPRGFYRPHSGFPAWRPSEDRQQALDEALAWAARNDRVACLAPLVELGARLEADVYRGTALGWAAWCGATAAVGELLRLGAAVDGRTSFGGPTHGESATPLMLAAQEGRAEVVEVLLAAGADRRARDALYDGRPSGWAEVGGHAALARRLSRRRPGAAR